MKLPGFLRPRPWRLLRSAIKELRRIADGLDRHNQLLEALHPDVVAQMRALNAVTVESDVSYVDPHEILRAEEVRARYATATGKTLSDDELLDFMRIEDELDHARPRD